MNEDRGMTQRTYWIVEWASESNPDEWMGLCTSSWSEGVWTYPTPAHARTEADDQRRRGYLARVMKVTETREVES